MNPLRGLPNVDALSRAPSLAGYPERVRVAAARSAIERMRTAIRSGVELNGESAEGLAIESAKAITESSFGSVHNLSGVILHSGLGRARLGKAVSARLAEVAEQYSLLEFDAESGRRGNRQEHVRGMLTELTGAESALVVNNAAGAVFLALSSLAKGREVILSRGQMVEIGGSFRMPDIVTETGCRLVEVGCTNKTRIGDYEAALTDATGAILRCHPSNYAIVGFVEQPTPAELAELAHKRQILYIDDMGTGCIVDTRGFGMPRLPTIQDSVEAGADIVIASGDKLLGGPQAGLILGRRELIDRVEKHPLARAMRIDKLSLCALETVLKLYSTGQEEQIPTIAFLRRPLGEVREYADRLSACVAGSVVREGLTELGSGSAPDVGTPTWRVGISTSQPDTYAKRLRLKGVIGRIEDGLVWLDPRTLEDDEELEQVCEVLESI